MCTLSVIAVPGGVRVVCNRDEQRTRRASTPPTWRTGLSGLRAIWPTDPEGGGTWIAAGEHGMVLALLNQTPMEAAGVPSRRGRVSRGVIIPELVWHAGLDDVSRRLAGMRLSDFSPFRLVGAKVRGDGTHEVIAWSWDGDRLTRVLRGMAPVCLASSGLGDALVQERVTLFGELVGRKQGAELQDAFHAHRWEDRPEVSVMMSRSDARTVSVTRVQVTASGGVTQAMMRVEGVEDAPIAARAVLASPSGS
jgi:hypothetical protein